MNLLPKLSNMITTCNKTEPGEIVLWAPTFESISDR
jgi:hypothetical protein